MNLAIATACEQDIETIMRFFKELVERYEDLQLIDLKMILKWERNKLENDIREYSRILADGETAGYFCFCRHEDKMELDDLYIFPEFQNRGIGTWIIQHCISKTSLPIFLVVFSDNEGAVRLYQKMGFQILRKISGTRIMMERMPDNKIL